MEVVPLLERETQLASLGKYAHSLCSLSRGGEAVAAAQAAVALLEPLGPTAELAWAYASLAAMWMVRGASTDAIELARRAQEIAGPLGRGRGHLR